VEFEPEVLEVADGGKIANVAIWVHKKSKSKEASFTIHKVGCVSPNFVFPTVLFCSRFVAQLKRKLL
jgi:hypothetical protein